MNNTYQEEATVKSTGIVRDVVKLNYGSTVVIIEDTINNFTLKDVINFKGTLLKVGDSVNIIYKENGSRIEYAIEPVKVDTMYRNK